MTRTPRGQTHASKASAPAGRAIVLRPAGSRIAGCIARASQRRETEKLVAQMDSENATFAERLRSAEAREAFLAFAQKRPPDFAKLAGQ